MAIFPIQNKVIYNNHNNNTNDNGNIPKSTKIVMAIFPPT